jgi:hypothetical protein
MNFSVMDYCCLSNSPGSLNNSLAVYAGLNESRHAINLLSSVPREKQAYNHQRKGVTLRE